MSSIQRLSAGRVSWLVLELLLRFQGKFGQIKSPPVPLDDILAFLGLKLEFDDLSARFGVLGKLGFLAIDTHQIFVDQSLDPANHPEMEGRLNFTIAHEIAHWILHRRIVDRHLLTAEENNWLERQADWFASSLLMPGWLVKNEWKAKFGHTGPLVITPEMEAAATANFGSRPAAIKALGEHHAAELARSFKVSQAAMWIRLQQLGLIPRE